MTEIEIPQTLIDDALHTINRCRQAHSDGLNKGDRAREIYRAFRDFMDRGEDDVPLRTAVYTLLGGACGAIVDHGAYESTELIVFDTNGKQINPDDTSDPIKQGATAAIRMLAAFAADDQRTASAVFNTVADAFVADDGPEGVARHWAMVYVLLNQAAANLAAQAGGAS